MTCHCQCMASGNTVAVAPQWPLLFVFVFVSQAFGALAYCPHDYRVLLIAPRPPSRGNGAQACHSGAVSTPLTLKRWNYSALLHAGLDRRQSRRSAAVAQS